MTMLTLFAKPNCKFCGPIERILQQRGLLYTKVDVTAPENAEQLQNLRDRGFMSVPVLYDPARDDYHVGADPDWLPEPQQTSAPQQSGAHA